MTRGANEKLKKIKEAIIKIGQLIIKHRKALNFSTTDNKKAFMAASIIPIFINIFISHSRKSKVLKNHLIHAFVIVISSLGECSGEIERKKTGENHKRRDADKDENAYIS